MSTTTNTTFCPVCMAELPDDPGAYYHRKQCEQRVAWDKVSAAMAAGAPQSEVYERQEQSSLDPQGISVGWADVYDRALGDQWIPLTGVPDGFYWMELRVDPRGRIEESNEGNNTTWVKVRIEGLTVETFVESASVWRFASSSYAGRCASAAAVCALRNQ